MVQSPDQARSTDIGNDKLLFGTILGLLAFWPFAQTTLNIGPVMADDLRIRPGIMNSEVSIAALFPGMFVVVIEP